MLNPSENREKLLQSLIAAKRKTGPTIVLSERREAAVLLPLVPTGEGYDLLFEKRSPDIVQGGEICFPGGSVEDGESPQEAAERETKEELLLPESGVTVLCPLHVIQGPGGRKVTSFLGILSDYHDTFSTDEVEKVLRLPLADLLEQDPVIAEADATPRLPEDFPFFRIPGGRDYPWQHVKKRCYFYDTPEENRKPSQTFSSGASGEEVFFAASCGWMPSRTRSRYRCGVMPVSSRKIFVKQLTEEKHKSSEISRVRRELSSRRYFASEVLAFRT